MMQTPGKSKKHLTIVIKLGEKGCDSILLQEHLLTTHRHIVNRLGRFT